MQIWFNDCLVEANSVGIASDGWPGGEGIFETIKTENSEVFELGRHMRRAIDAAAKTGIALPNEDLIRKAIVQILAKEPHQVGRLRLMFANDLFVVAHFHYEEETPPAKLVTISDPSKATAVSLKSYPYKHRLDLLATAKEQGFDEIICLNSDGEISEGAVSNFIFRIDGKWITSPLSSGVLPGVQRAIVIERCGVGVKAISRSDMARADAAFVISSLKIAISVSEIDGRVLKIDKDCAALEADIRAKTIKHSVG